jgi:Flp pilus assembly protein TadD
MKLLIGRLGRQVTVLIAILALAIPVLAADNTLDVKCVDQAGGPAAGVKVQIQHMGTGKWKDKKSDAKGMASFNKLDDGLYRVLARKDGSAAAFYEFAVMKGSAQQSVTLRFEPGDPVQKVYFEDPELGRKADELLNQGVEMLRTNKFAEAEKMLQESIKIRPSNPDAQYNLAIALLQEQKWEPAEEALKTVINLANAMGVVRKADAPGSNPFAEMGQRAQEVLTKIPVFRLRTEADKDSRERRFDEAISKYQKAVQLEPSDADLYYNLGLALANGRRFDEALQTVDKAIALKPSEAAYRELKNKIVEFKENAVLLKAKGILEEGDKLYQASDFAGALKKYQEAIPMIPEKNQPGVWTQIARTYAKMKQGDQAVQAFKKAMDIAPDQPNYRKELAQYYLNEKKYEEALNVYADMRASGSATPDQMLFSLGQTLSNQGNSDVAELAFEKAIKVNPQHAESYYELGMLLYYSKKNDKRAKELLAKYLELGKAKDHIDNATAVLVVIKRRSP